MNHIAAKIPELANIFLETGQITEDQFHCFGIPEIKSDDRRTKPKDQRELSNQRAVLLTSEASRSRRKQYLLSKEPVSTANALGDDNVPKRKRKPNRPREVIEAEKAAKLARKEARESKQPH